MHSVRITTNETCNQNCSFCNARHPVERPDFVAPASVRARIDAAVRSKARELVLTGGEPTLRRDLPALVAYARAAGIPDVTLETNGTLIGDALAHALAHAGLTLARVHLPLWGDPCDGITRDPGGFEHTRRALDALARAGIPLELSVPVVRANAEHIPALPAAIVASGLAVRGLCVEVPTDAPDREALLPPFEAARAIHDLVIAARGQGLTVRIDPGAALPPCFFPQPALVAHIFALTRGGADRPNATRLPGCSECTVHDRCPGVPRAVLARDPGITVRPIRDDKTRRRLSVISTVEAQIARELVSRDIFRDVDQVARFEHIVRVNFHCNQSCRFCFVSTHLPQASHEAITRAITEVAGLHGVLSLSGGEPTLNPRLEEYVRLGISLGVHWVELQTNAIRLANPGLAQSLADAGVSTFFVSLHGSTAEISDAVTEAPGTFEKTVQGLDAIATTGKRLRINHVFCQKNLGDFPNYVRMVHARWPTAVLTVSFVASSTDVVPRERSLVPRYSEVLPFLAEGVRLARALGLELTGFESMCGVPLCLIPEDVSAYFHIAEIEPGFDRGEFLKVDACQRCELQRQCFGVRRGYAELHGTDELTPVRGQGRGSTDASNEPSPAHGRSESSTQDVFGARLDVK